MQDNILRPSRGRDPTRDPGGSATTRSHLRVQSEPGHLRGPESQQRFRRQFQKRPAGQCTQSTRVEGAAVQQVEREGRFN